MAGILPQAFGIPLAFLAPALTWANPSGMGDKAPMPSPPDASVYVDSRTGFRLVTHEPHIEAAKQIMRVPEADQGRGPVNDQRRLLSPSGPANFRRSAYRGSVAAAEARYALPSGLLDALVWTESRYNPLAVSNAGAAGLGQLMPGTARDMGVRNRMDPFSNLDGAARYLRLLIDKFGMIHLALAAYNAGPSAVERSGGIPLNGQTPRYVQDVLRRWKY